LAVRLNEGLGSAPCPPRRLAAHQGPSIALGPNGMPPAPRCRCLRTSTSSSQRMTARCLEIRATARLDQQNGTAAHAVRCLDSAQDTLSFTVLLANLGSVTAPPEHQAPATAFAWLQWRLGSRPGCALAVLLTPSGADRARALYFCTTLPNVRVKRAPTVWRLARAVDDKQHCRAGQAPRRWGSA